VSNEEEQAAILARMDQLRAEMRENDQAIARLNRRAWRRAVASVVLAIAGSFWNTFVFWSTGNWWWAVAAVAFWVAAVWYLRLALK
jgi:membrane protein YdbS with pleckstrin-like domain